MPQFNAQQFNSAQFNGGVNAAAVYSLDRVVFGDFSLSDNTYAVCTNLTDSGPSTDLVGGSVPRGDGMYVTARYFRDRTVEVSGIVKNTTAALLDAYLDTMRKALSTREGNLDLTDANGTVKRFAATCVNYEELFAGRRAYHTTYCPFTARFTCKTPFGKSRDYAYDYLAMASSPQTQSPFNAGTYKAPLVHILIFSAASSVTAVNLASSTTGESITYTGSIAAGDVLVFDGENLRVTKNGTAVDFTGAFVNLDAGANGVVTTVTGTSFAASVTAKWKPSYL